MSKLYSSAAPVALIVAASLFCSAANAAQQDAGTTSRPQVSQTQQAPADAVVQQAHGLTRKQVYDQLVQAEKDGSMARLNATLYEGS